MGKTILASEIALFNGLQDRKVVGIVSFSLSAEQLTVRFLHRMSGVPANPVLHQAFTSDEMIKIEEAAKKLSGSNIVIEDQPILKPDTLQERLDQVKIEHPLDLLIIDGLESIGKWESALFFGPDWFRNLASHLGLPVILTAPLSDEVSNNTNQMPTLAELPWNGDLGIAASLVLMVHREYVYSLTPDNKNLATLVIARNLHGPTGQVTMGYQSDCFEMKALA